MSDLLDGTSWVLTGPLPLVDGVDVTATFADGSVHGFSGCNRYNGSYRLDDDGLAVGALATTRMAGSREVMALETEVLQRVGRAVDALVEGDRLRLTDADGEDLLTFVQHRESDASAEPDGSAVLDGEYVPSPAAWVRDQVDAYERSGGTEANTLRDTGIPIIVVTMRGKSSGKVRKIALMRVEHEGEYALVASMGGAPKHPVWYHNLVADPTNVTVQDGPAPFAVSVREATGHDRTEWWDRCVAVFPNYADYQLKTERVIPVLIATPR